MLRSLEVAPIIECVKYLQLELVLLSPCCHECTDDEGDSLDNCHAVSSTEQRFRLKSQEHLFGLTVYVATTLQYCIIAFCLKFTTVLWHLRLTSVLLSIAISSFSESWLKLPFCKYFAQRQFHYVRFHSRVCFGLVEEVQRGQHSV